MDPREDIHEDLHEFATLFEIVLATLKRLLTKPGIIIISALLLLLVWGPRGVPVFTPLFEHWLSEDPAQRLWRLNLLSFGTGLLLLVLIPMLLIRFRFREPWRAYGLGLGELRLGLAFTLLLLVISTPFYYVAAKLPSMWAEYPLLYRGLDVAEIQARFAWSDFLLFELVYTTFIVAIEFIFRGYMLFGLRPRFGLYTVLLQMLPYTVWHLTKPTPELLTTPIWGFAVAAVALRVRSIWYAFAVHWLMVCFMDVLILHNRGVL